MEYTLIRSKRKTLAMQVKPQGVIVRAPLKASQRTIEAFVAEHEAWALKALAKLEASREAMGSQALSPADIKALAEKARRVIPERVRYYAPLVGVTYGRITIRHQRSKWGSCSAKGNLNFNCLLMLAPPETLDSVVVHELCHRRHMDHSAAFYADVLRVFPDYRKHNGWLKKNGAALMARMEAGENG